MFKMTFKRDDDDDDITHDIFIDAKCDYTEDVWAIAGQIADQFEREKDVMVRKVEYMGYLRVRSND